MILTHLGIMIVAYPKQTERNVISPRAESAPQNTSHLEFFIARMAEMKNVLSPISDTMITDKAAMKACTNPRVI